MLTHRQVEVFRTVMTYGTVSGAAEALRISQPAVSRIIRDIEFHLGLDLFERSHGRINPTTSAFDLMEEVERFFTGLDQIERSAREIALGRRVGLIIAAMPALAHTLAPDALAQVLEDHTDLVVRIMSMQSTNVMRVVSTRQANVGIISATIENLLGLRAVCTLTVPFRCILPAGHPLASRPNVTMKDLQAYPFIRFPSNLVTGKVIDRMIRYRELTIDSRIETHLSQMVSTLVRRGLGVAVVDAFTAREHAALGGVVLPVDLDGFQFPFSIVTRENHKLTQAEQDFVTAVETITRNLHY